MTYQLPEDLYPITVPHPTLGVPVQIGMVDYKGERADLLKDDVFVIFDFITKYQDKLTFHVFWNEEELVGLPKGEHLLIQKDEEGKVLPINPNAHGYIGLPIITEDGRHTSFQLWGLKNGIINLTGLDSPLGIYKTLEYLRYYLKSDEVKEDKIEKTNLSSIVKSDFTFLNKTYDGYYIDNKFYVNLFQIVRSEEYIWNLYQTVGAKNFKYLVIDRHNNVELVEQETTLLPTQRKIQLISWEDLVSRVVFENKK